MQTPLFPLCISSYKLSFLSSHSSTSLPMAPSLSETSSSFFQSYPEFLLSVTLFIIFFIYRLARCTSVLPVNWPVVGMLPSILANFYRFHDWVTEVSRMSGCTFHFLGPWFSSMEYLITCDLANANHIFNINFSNFQKGDDFSDMFDILGDGIFTADAESWKSQRQKMQLVLSDKRFRSFVVDASRDKVEKGLLPLLTLMVEEGEVVDLQDVMLRLTFDMTCHLVLGVDPGCLAVSFPTVGFAKAMDDAMDAVFLRHMLPTSWWKLMRFLGVGAEKKLARAREVIDGFVAETISHRRTLNMSKPDLLSSYIVDNDNSVDDDKFLRDTAVNLMLAGRDTTGATLGWFFWMLAENPCVEKRVFEELKECVSMPGSSMELWKLLYLHAALCETLRLFPPVPVERKCVVRSDVLPSGAVVRPGLEVLFSVYAMGRMEGVWGKDCMEFKPERWISEQGKLRHEPSYKFLSFNSGPRTCLGRDIAFTQMKAVAAAVVYNFCVEGVRGHVVEPKPSIILHMKNGLLVKIRKRANEQEWVVGKD